jgi:hypothetical protein
VLAHKYRAGNDRYIVTVTTTSGFVERLYHKLQRSEALSLIWGSDGFARAHRPGRIRDLIRPTMASAHVNRCQAEIVAAASACSRIM